MEQMSMGSHLSEYRQNTVNTDGIFTSLCAGPQRLTGEELLALHSSFGTEHRGSS